MPWTIRDGGADCRFEVVKETDGKREGCHATKAEAEAHVRALYASEPEAMMRAGMMTLNEVRTVEGLLIPESDDYRRVPVVERAAILQDVNSSERILTVMAVPFNEETVVEHRGQAYLESFDPSAFDGIQTRKKTIPVSAVLTCPSYTHEGGHLIGKVSGHHLDRTDGLVVDVKVSDTAAGNETLALAADGTLSPSVGYQARPKDVVMNRTTMTRRVNRAFLHHLALVPHPAYEGAKVLAMRAETETEMVDTPELDAFLSDPIMNWASQRLAAAEERADSNAQYGDVKYADPGYKNGVKKYPIDTEEHARAALAYFSMPKNHEGYTSEQISAMMARIKSACKRFGIQLAGD